MKVKHVNKIEKKMKEKNKDYEPMLEKFIGIQTDLNNKISKNLEDQETEFAKKKRERRERSISKSMDKGKKKREMMILLIQIICLVILKGKKNLNLEIWIILSKFCYSLFQMNLC